MEDVLMQNQVNLSNETAAQALQKACSFEIKEQEESIFDDSRYQQLKLSSIQKGQCDLLVQQIPTLMASNTLANSYKCVFPEGVTGTLMKLKQGGVSGPIIGADGKIVGHASFVNMTSEAALLNIFTVMSVAVGQYFLTAINNELKMINQKIDKILDFLYGNQKAELLAEIGFVQQIYQNYNSIMQHSEQRIATISGLQRAKNIAMKDIEFYMSDLTKMNKHAFKSFDDFHDTCEEAFQIKDSMEMSMQLFTMASIMEVYVSQNYDTEYIACTKENASYYIRKCNARIHSEFGKLIGKCNSFMSAPKVAPIKAIMQKKINPVELERRLNKIIEPLSTGADSPLLATLNSALDAVMQPNEFYLTRTGDVYVKTK